MTRGLRSASRLDRAEALARPARWVREDIPVSVKQLCRVVAASALAASVVAAPVTAAGSGPGRQTVVCVSPAPIVSSIDKFREAGQTIHLRGWTASYTSSGDPLCAGHVEVVANLEISHGIGGIQGTVVYRLTGIDGGWVGTFEQVWAKDQLTYGREVARGFGALEGWQLRAVLDETFEQVITETDEIFAPGQ
jgi:hypothetical protein